jgi:hypothetical protein
MIIIKNNHKNIGKLLLNYYYKPIHYLLLVIYLRLINNQPIIEAIKYFYSKIFFP